MEDKNVLLLNNILQESSQQTNQTITAVALAPITTAGPTESEIVSELVSFGISLIRANQLANQYGEDRCRVVIKHVPTFAESKRQVGWLIKALSDGWQLGISPRLWKANSAIDIDALIAVHGRPPVIQELDRRALESEKTGNDVQAIRRHFIVNKLRSGLTGAEAIEAANSLPTLPKPST